MTDINALDIFIVLQQARKVFIITDTAERKLSGPMGEHRARISALASKQKNGDLLHIFVPPVGTDIPLETKVEKDSNSNV
jgi:hypothetical protein